MDKNAPANDHALKLETQESLAAILVDASPAMVAYLDRDGRYRLVNLRMATVAGMRAQEMEGMSALDPQPFGVIISPSAFRRAVAGEEMIVQSDVARADGAAMTVEIRYCPRVVDGVTVGVCVYAVDVSDRVRAANNLHASRERFRNLIEIIPHGIMRSDLQGRVLLANPAMADMLAYRVGDLTGCDFWDLVAPFNLEEQKARFHHALTERPDPEPFIINCLRKDGAVIDVLLTWNYETAEDGSVLSFIAVMTDVTEELEAERALLEAKELAETATREKSRFLAATSHDLQQPLHSLSIMLGVLQARLAKDTREGEILSSMERALKGAQSMLHTVLELSRLEAGVVMPHIQTIAVGELFQEIKAELGLQMVSDRIELRVLEARYHMVSDRMLMKSILYNLVSNAIRYTPSGKVLLGVRRRGNFLSIEVWDTGVGIPHARQQDIFDEFTRLGDQRNPGGVHALGLGLSIVHQACKLLGHDLEVESKVGSGSVFRVQVPMALPESEEGPASRAHDRVQETAADRIILVEDDPDTCAAIEGLLDSWGVECQIVQTLNEVREVCDATKVPDLVLADLNLNREETGLDVIDEVRRFYKRQIPGILITAQPDGMILARARSRRIPVMAKPFNPARLRALVSFQISSHEART